MSEDSSVFKTRVQESQIEENPPQITEVEVADLKGFETPTKDEPTSDEHRLEIWEVLNNRKYGTDYFNIRETVNTFPIKAEFTYIDKFIKSELKERSLEPTIENYKELLSEIESEIGTEKTETYKRINRIFNYIKVLTKYRELKQRKESFRALYTRDF